MLQLVMNYTRFRVAPEMSERERYAVSRLQAVKSIFYKLIYCSKNIAVSYASYSKIHNYVARTQP